MTKRVLVAAVAALFAFAGCSQQTAKPEAPAVEENTTVAAPAPVVEEVQLVEEEVATPHSMKEMAVETVQTVK